MHIFSCIGSQVFYLSCSQVTQNVCIKTRTSEVLITESNYRDSDKKIGYFLSAMFQVNESSTEWDVILYAVTALIWFDFLYNDED